MEFRLLGPVEVWADGRPLVLGGPKPRTLLAALLLARGRVVPVARLVDVIWGDDPPAGARGLVQTYVKALRRTFAQARRDGLIATRPAGYAVVVEPEAVDLAAFERLVADARSAGPRDAADLYGRALALWRGPALADLPRGLAGEALRLDEQRLAAQQEWIEAQLAAGRTDHLAELTTLVDAHPTDERLRTHLMTTLYRLGRQADALAAYRQARTLLVEELGVEPGLELTAVHDAILRGELPMPAADGVAVAATTPVPAQLPPVPADFTGRSAEVTGLLTARAGVRVIAGPGGAGKSALAARVAAELAPAYPDGQLYADLRGMSDAPATPGEVMARFLPALGVDEDRLPDAPERRVELYRTLLADRTVLILLDDARSEQQVRPLLPGNPRCTVIVTARDRLLGLAGAALTDLDVLTDEDAAGLLERLVGADRLATDPVAVASILEYCGNLPLAIRIAGARLVSRPSWPLKLLADRLADGSRRLTELSAGDLAVRSSIGSSYAALTELEGTALRRMGYAGLPDYSAWVVGWLLDVPRRAAEEVLEDLVDAQVVEVSKVDGAGTIRYRLHDLVRLYARERAEAEEPVADLHAAVARTLGGWLALIGQIGTATPPEEVAWRYTISGRVRIAEQGAVRATADPGDWFSAEQPAVVAGVERAAAIGLYQLVCEFAAVGEHAVASGPNRFEYGTRINEAALAAARGAGDTRAEAAMIVELGKVRHNQDRYAEARQLYTEALTQFRDLGDLPGQAAALAGLGSTCREPGYLLESLHFLERAAALLDELGDDAGYAYVRRLSGSVHLERGSFEEAKADLDASLGAYRAHEDRRGEGLTLRTIGLWHRARGEYPEAAEVGEHALRIFTDLGDEHMQAYAVRALAKSRLRAHGPDGVLSDLERALSVCHEVGDRWGQAVTLRVLGQAHLAANTPELAESCLEAALRLWQSIDAPLWAARTEYDLSLVYGATGRHDEAARRRDLALRVFRDHGAREFHEVGRVPAEFQRSSQS